MGSFKNSLKEARVIVAELNLEQRHPFGEGTKGFPARNIFVSLLSVVFLMTCNFALPHCLVSSNRRHYHVSPRWNSMDEPPTFQVLPLQCGSGYLAKYNRPRKRRKWETSSVVHISK